MVGGNFGAVLFFDTGNVWANSGGFNLGDLRYDVGPGLRYQTPVGPIRLDFGYQLNPPYYQATVIPPGGTVGVLQTLRLPHFGFFFNIGPIF